jgi:hypothetical protein
MPTSPDIRRTVAVALARLGWTRSSYLLLSLFLAMLFVMVVVWWPLVVDYWATADPSRPLWVQLDWLLLGIFAAMSLLIMSGADLKADALIVAIGFAGGLVIESWGTQTSLWTYYTHERPPLWIIPAWPIASLAIDRLYRTLAHLTEDERRTTKATGTHLTFAFRHSSFVALYWLLFPAFYLLMLYFVWPTSSKSFTLMALGLCALMIVTPTDHRAAVLTFIAGAGLGYFLELWGTTRECWTYYTRETPPLFAVLAHGMAAVAFWRAGLLVKMVGQRMKRMERIALLFGCHARESGHPEGFSGLPLSRE